MGRVQPRARLRQDEGPAADGRHGTLARSAGLTRPGTSSPSPWRCRLSIPAARTRWSLHLDAPARMFRVGIPGSLSDDIARLEAVRDALGSDGVVRCDAGGRWDIATRSGSNTVAGQGIRRIRLYVEQPCAAVDDVARYGGTSTSGSPFEQPSGRPSPKPPTCASSAPAPPGYAPSVAGGRNAAYRALSQRLW